jgi:hypothetical protein
MVQVIFAHKNMSHQKVIKLANVFIEKYATHSQELSLEEDPAFIEYKNAVNEQWEKNWFDEDMSDYLKKLKNKFVKSEIYTGSIIDSYNQYLSVSEAAYWLNTTFENYNAETDLEIDPGSDSIFED